MHKLFEYVCDELKDLEKKAEKGNMSLQEIQYADTLAHLKKNLLEADEMMEDDFGEYSLAYYPMTSHAEEGGGRASYAGRRSYASGRGSGARRDSMGRYSRAGEDFRSTLESLIEDAPSERIRQKLRDLMREM